jgi:hypothetical protein
MSLNSGWPRLVPLIPSLSPPFTGGDASKADSGQLLGGPRGLSLRDESQLRELNNYSEKLTIECNEGRGFRSP